jgi:hypothetical protein
LSGHSNSSPLPGTGIGCPFTLQQPFRPIVPPLQLHILNRHREAFRSLENTLTPVNCTGLNHITCICRLVQFSSSTTMSKISTLLLHNESGPVAMIFPSLATRMAVRQPYSCCNPYPIGISTRRDVHIPYLRARLS